MARPVRESLLSIPVAAVGAVILVVCVLQALPVIFPGVPLLTYAARLEWMSYDLRVQSATLFRTPAASCLGVVYLDQESLEMVNRNYGYSWPWPRQMHGRLVSELSAQGARVVGFDVLFEERHPFDYRSALPIEPRQDPAETSLLSTLAGLREPEYQPADRLLGSDGYLALEMRRAGNVVLGVMGNVVERRDGVRAWESIEPHPMLATNALALGHIMGEADVDGVLRRARAYYDDQVSGRRYWQLGIVLAARYLDLDLERAVVRRGSIEVPGRHGAGRVLPIDSSGSFLIDWSLRHDDPEVKAMSYQTLLEQEIQRSNGKTNLAPGWAGKLVVVGSIAAGNNASDLGATPVSSQTFLVSKYWNVANQIIQDRFIQRSSYATEAALIVLMGILSGIVTWRLRVLRAALVLLLVVGVYLGLAFSLFVSARYWLPVTLPVGGAVVLTHLCLVSFRVVVEQKERNRVRSVFSKVVSPDVVNELLKSADVSLGGTRRRVTVYFADIRGFTAMTDEGHAQAEEYVRQHGLKGQAAEEWLEAQAREILSTVNLYLGVVADTIRRHQGTFDKYIGDCAMAFWGAPQPDERHAVECVRAAVEAQRRIYQLNFERAAENRRREVENEARSGRGEPPLPRLTLLALGSGINTGFVTVGLMGSDKHILNYTVFGREVNLASRLEGISGRGRIIISDSTYRDLVRLDPELADACLGLPAVQIKGFRDPVQVYEVQWRRLGDDAGYDTGLVVGGASAEHPAPSRSVPSGGASTPG